MKSLIYVSAAISNVVDVRYKYFLVIVNKEGYEFKQTEVAFVFSPYSENAEMFFHEGIAYKTFTQEGMVELNSDELKKIIIQIHESEESP